MISSGRQCYENMSTPLKIKLEEEEEEEKNKNKNKNKKNNKNKNNNNNNKQALMYTAINEVIRGNNNLTFRHHASCILGQAFLYSPEKAFYIFNQQIYFII